MENTPEICTNTIQQTRRVSETAERINPFPTHTSYLFHPTNPAGFGDSERMNAFPTKQLDKFQFTSVLIKADNLISPYSGRQMRLK